MKEALPSGGAERQLALITEYLPERWERRVWTMGGGPFVEVIRQHGQRVDVSARAARLDVRPAADLWRLLREWRPDVVHSWDWMSSLAALPVCRALGIPIVDGTIRNGIARRRRSLPLRARHGRLQADRSQQPGGAGRVGGGGRQGPGRVQRLRPGALAPLRRAPGERSGAAAGSGDASGRTTVVMTGRMVAHKDFATVIAAAADLDAGSRGAGASCCSATAPSGRACRLWPATSWRATWSSSSTPASRCCRSCARRDVGVLMSNEAQHTEGCSNAIMEYMACRLPVVCSAGGGNPELVLHGETGFLVP